MSLPYKRWGINKDMINRNEFFISVATTFLLLLPANTPLRLAYCEKTILQYLSHDFMFQRDLFKTQEYILSFDKPVRYIKHGILLLMSTYGRDARAGDIVTQENATFKSS